jgi:hypothetical protein
MGHSALGAPCTQNALRRLLSNVLYTGAVRHRGQLYPGEQEAILEPETWQRVQRLLTQRPHSAPAKGRHQHQALLSGLLYCQCCGTRMVHAYTTRNQRRYCYYVCLNAQRHGWAACPSKSLPAQALEESVLQQIEAAITAPGWGADWSERNRTQQVELLQAVVERIGYDGTTRQVSIRFRSTAHAVAIGNGDAGPEQPA